MPEGWFRRNWWKVIWNLALIIGLIYGSILGFTSEIQKTLNVELTLTQTIALGLIVVTSLGLILTIARSILHSDKPRPFASFYRVDKFDANMDKKVYQWGQSMFFLANFSGLLTAGYFDAVLVPPSNTMMYYVWDPQTLLSSVHIQGGELHGEIRDYHSRWSLQIMVGSETGEWTANIGVYDSLPMDWWTLARVRFFLNWLVRKIVKKDVRFLARRNRPCIDERTVRFSVIKRLEDGRA